MSNDTDKPASKADIESALREMHNFVLERETSLIWKVIALQVTLIGAISAAQWGMLFFVLQHLQWKAS